MPYSFSFNFFLRLVWVSLLLFTILAGCQSTKTLQAKDKMNEDVIARAFISPPDSIQTSVYWYWLSDNISKEGVIKDLLAMKQAGINRAFIGNIFDGSTPAGSIKMFSEDWWEVLHTALKTASELNIEIGIFNSPGWSQSGGPWIKPSQSMRYLSGSEIRLLGPGPIDTLLPRPAEQFEDVRLIAYKAPSHYGDNIADHHPVIKVSKPVDNLKFLFDDNRATIVQLPVDDQLAIDFTTKEDFTLRSIAVVPPNRGTGATIEVQAFIDGQYLSLKTFKVDRENTNLNVGFDRFAPVTISVSATKSTKFRVIITKATIGFSIAELKLSSSPALERYSEKTLAKMYPQPLPYWKEYQWPQQPPVEDSELIIDPKTVIDISSFLDSAGQLSWMIPAGEWVLMRLGMRPTGVTNTPASPEATGLEVDKMSKRHVESHFNAFFGEILKRIPAEDRKTWRVTVQDSYETGGQNWTDDMITRFKSVYHYDPLVYLPAMQGKVVGSPGMSDRFLWDLRRLIADRVAYDYVGGLREISHQHGLHTWLENYGHWGFPGEFLQYGGQSDEIGGEFWSEGELGNIENRAASSAAHIYGKTKVSAESFTAGLGTYARYPQMLKQRGDRFFTEGINNSLLHVFIHQPYERMPGINSWFGTEFNRHNTWFPFMNLFTSYLKRCNFMLQQGKYVADVAYFIGEDAPKMTGVTDPALPQGYSFDYINAEVIMQISRVENGRFFLPNGMNYGLLVLPKLETMRPELLQKITEMVAAGANILGPAPFRSPSLENYPSADKRVQALAAALWGNIDGEKITSRKFGKGNVMNGISMQSALDKLNISPDLDSGNDSVLFIHRTMPGKEIYFLSNQSAAEIKLEPAFRVTGKKPFLWDPVNGNIRPLPQFFDNSFVTSVPLQLRAAESYFIVFRDGNEENDLYHENFPKQTIIKNIDNPWSVYFDSSLGMASRKYIFDTLADWTERPEEFIRYFSGKATYRNTFRFSKHKRPEQVMLDLGEVKVMAKVKINGKYAGGLWTNPWQIDVTNFLIEGENTIEIEVVNTWVNRLIGDIRLPENDRKTYASVNPYKVDSELATFRAYRTCAITSLLATSRMTKYFPG